MSTADEDEEVRVLNGGSMREEEVDPDFERELAALVSEHQGPGAAFSASQQVRGRLQTASTICRRMPGLAAKQ